MKNLICISVIMLLLFMCFPKNGMAQSTPNWNKRYLDNSLVLPGMYYGMAVSDKKVYYISPRSSGRGQILLFPNMRDSNNKFLAFTNFIIGKEVEYQTQMTTRKETILFTKEEVKNLHHSDMEWQKPLIRLRSKPPGPVIKFQTPNVQELSVGPTIQTNSPVDLIILFSQNQHPVNMNSLKVIAKKGFFSKSLTDILKDYIRGNVLEAQGVKVPAGKFKIQVSIADQKGNRTIKTYRLLVRK